MKMRTVIVEVTVLVSCAVSLLGFTYYHFASLL